MLLVVAMVAVAVRSQTVSARVWRNVSLDSYVHTVYSLYQDSRGIVWVGTSQGLYRYDGYVTHQIMGREERAGSQFHCLVERGDRLYLGTNNGLLLYNMSTASYEPIDGEFPSEIRSMALDGEEIWIGSLGGLYRYDMPSGAITRVATGLPHQAVYALLRSREGDIYVGTYNGLCRYNRVESRLEPIEVTGVGNAAGNIFVNSLAEDATRGCIWVGTEGALLRYDKAHREIAKKRELTQNSVKALAVAQDGRILAGTDAGLYILDNDGWELARHDSRLWQSIANNVVWSVMVDRAGNYWAGTEQDFSVSCNNAGFEVVALSDITGRGDGNRIYTMLRDSHERLWIGGSNGIIRYDGRSGESRWYMSGDGANALSHNRVRDIYEDRSGNVWIATDGSVNRYDDESERWINYRLTDRSRTLNANWAYSIFEDDESQMWIGSFLGGILVADRNKLIKSKGVYEAEKAYNASTGLPNNLINQMKIDANGNKWMLFFRDNTLLRIDGKDGSEQRIDIYEIIEASPAYIVCDSDGGVWIGYSGGVVKVDDRGKVGTPVKFPMRYGENLLAMAQVGGEIWASTDDGIWAVERSTSALRLLTLPAKAYTSIYYDRQQKRVLLGGVDELTSVNPDISRIASHPDSIYITGIRVNGEAYNSAEEPLMQLSVLKLSHDENQIEVTFSDLSYALDNRTHYEYRLVGRDKLWTLLEQDDNRIVVSELAPGEYALEIRQSRGDGDVEPLRRIQIEVMPPWYASLWAIMLYIVSGVLLSVWAINFVRVRNRLRFERIERERALASVKERMDFLTSVSHEFKTPLSMIIGPLSKLLDETRDGKLRRSIDSVYTNAMKLNALVHSALEINRIEERADKFLIYSRVNLVEFSRGIFDSYREAYPTKHFIFTFTTERLVTEVDVVKIESVINNLLSNACKYSSDESTIAYSIAREDESVVIKVSDDGIGIPEEERQLIFHRMFRSSRTADSHEGTGIGLYLVKQYVEMHNGTIDVTGREGEGTTFVITIPLREVADDIESADEDSTMEDGRSRVLIVDDNHAIASFIKEVLHGEYNCFTATNGRAGLAVCAVISPDLIIADEMMPVMSGLEMCRRLKSNPRTATIPIIMLTAKDDASTEAESMKVGVDTFMPKPFEAPMLKARVAQLIGAKASMRADVRIEQLTAARPVEAESVAERQLAEVAQVIEDNIADTNLNVGFVCEKTGLQSKQLYRLVKKYIGVSPVEYIKQIRLRKAAMLLDQHTFTVAEVMYMVGFSSSSYFSKCFQAQYGCTPRQYLERQVDK